MIDAGSGYPPHWRGESGQANLATATAMQAPTERHLLRRQRYFAYILQDVCYKAYLRAVEVGKVRPFAGGIGSPNRRYGQLFTPLLPDISRSDNESLTRSARDLSQVLSALTTTLGGGSPARSQTLARLTLRLVFKFAGEPQPEAVIEQILLELGDGA